MFDSTRLLLSVCCLLHIYEIPNLPRSEQAPAPNYSDFRATTVSSKIILNTKTLGLAYRVRIMYINRKYIMGKELCHEATNLQPLSK